MAVAQKIQSADAKSVADFSKEQELSAYRTMLTIRRFEEKAGQMYGMGLIGGFCHLYIGQEAVVVGMQMVLNEGDQVITGYRDHGHMIATGMDPKGVMAELTGRAHGYSRGKGGSMHMFSVEKGFYGGHGIVGAQVPLGTGLSFANRYRGNKNLSVTYFGDGAANQGQVYESFNMAELWKLPVIYVIENNRYAMGTSITRSSAEVNLSRRGLSFNIPGDQVDGMDVRAVKAAGERAAGSRPRRRAPACGGNASGGRSGNDSTSVGPVLPRCSALRRASSRSSDRISPIEAGAGAPPAPSAEATQRASAIPGSGAMTRSRTLRSTRHDPR